MLSFAARRARVLIRARALSNTRRSGIQDAIETSAGVFAPLAQAFIEHFEKHISGGFEGYKSALDKLDLSVMSDSFTDDFAFITGSRYLAIRRLTQSILLGDMQSSGHEKRELSLVVLRARDLDASSGINPMAAQFALLGQKLGLNLTDEEYYSLSGLERTRAFTVWGVTEAETRQAIGKHLQESFEAGEAFYDPAGGRSFYSRIKEELVARYSPGKAPAYPGGEAFADLAGTEIAGWHAHTIFDTNLATVQNRAMMDEAWELRDVFPYVEYLNAKPEFEACVWLSAGGGPRGRVFKIDDPVVQDFVPPLHFRCDTTVVPCMESEVADSPRDRKRRLTGGAQVPPHVKPMIYEGPYPIKGTPAPFGKWRPPDPLLAAGKPPPIPAPDAGTHFGTKAAAIKAEITRLTWEKRELLAKLDYTSDAGERRALKIRAAGLNRRLRDKTQAHRFILDLAKPAEKLDKTHVYRGRTRQYEFASVKSSLDKTMKEFLHLPRESDPLYNAAIARFADARQDLLWKLDRHKLSLTEVQQLKAELAKFVVWDKAIPGYLRNKLEDALDYFPLRLQARAILSSPTLKVRLRPFHERGPSFYTIKNTIFLRKTKAGKIPADVVAHFMHEFQHSVDLLYVKPAIMRSDFTTPPAFDEWLRHVSYPKMIFRDRPGLGKALSQEDIRRVFHIYGNYTGDLDELLSVLVESGFSWTVEDGEFLDFSSARRLRKGRRVSHIVKTFKLRELLLDHLREF